MAQSEKTSSPSPSGESLAGVPDPLAKRRHPRHPVAIHVQVFELGEGGVPVREWLCQTQDISRGGLGLLSDRMVHVGRHVLLVMPDAAGKGKRLLFAVVRSASYESGRGHLLGVEFAPMPRSSALLAWCRAQGLPSAA